MIGYLLESRGGWPEMQNAIAEINYRLAILKLKHRPS